MKSRSKALKVVFGITTAGILITLAVFLWMAFGMDRSGWTEENGLYSYLDSRGEPITGWMEEDGNQYFHEEEGGFGFIQFGHLPVNYFEQLHKTPPDGNRYPSGRNDTIHCSPPPERRKWGQYCCRMPGQRR